MTNPAFDGTPQFNKAEYIGESGAEHCSACHQPIAGSYYRVNGQMACPTCASQANALNPNDTHATFVRALLFGAGGALLGLILYSAFGIITGLVIGYLSLAVGYVVGKAMMMGSKGVGGRRYQVAAVLFTYAAVSLSAIPMGVAYAVKHRQERKATEHSDADASEEQKNLEREFGKSEPVPSQSAPVTNTPSAPPRKASPTTASIAAGLGYLALVGLASPFLELADPVHGFIGLIILVVGIRIAWRMTGARRAEIDGPFQNAAPSI